jgi:glucose-6-phosphate isomerase
MSTIKLNLENIYQFIPKGKTEALAGERQKALDTLYDRNGPGNDFLGWLDLPAQIEKAQLAEIEQLAANLRNKIDILVVVGIGGSYLGTRAVDEALGHHFAGLMQKRENPLILYAGHNISEDYVYELRELLDEKSYGLCVISKSGTTTEPAIAFRILRKHLEENVGKEEASQRIIAITDKEKGALRQVADENGFASFVIPDDIGGRYSVLTPVGLVPLAIGGTDVRALVAGAREMQKAYDRHTALADDPVSQYAAARNLLFREGYTTEILVNYNPKLHYMAEWWKQLYGESEGKESTGIFPASVDFTTDLHSLGQYVQEGLRMLFETVISVKETKHLMEIPEDSKNLDKLNYLAGKKIDHANKMAELGTMLAHVDGGVPNIHIEIPALNERYLGQLIYFFEKACAISGYMLGVNPFDQPGVEAYKKNMFALLGKPGFEKAGEELRRKLNKND